ncbi:MAG: hypothetical protein CMD18_02065 [Flavobacteriales bacterium]|nr:hypothetical protein [Flavobacteriales bacterium]|tara:strand:+ start:394 stop:582 length:189 start_codon:yes stop_codon:yes gene_type:complete
MNILDMKTEEQYDAILKRIIGLLNSENRTFTQEKELLDLYQQIENYTIFDLNHFTNTDLILD